MQIQLRIRDIYTKLIGTADRPELEQSWLRVLIAFVVMVYLFSYSSRESAPTLAERQVLLVSVAFFIFGIALSLRILLSGRPSVLRRYLAMTVDNVVTTYCLMNMGDAGTVVICVYLFITFGNGFRFGRKYLHVCQALGVAGFTSVLFFSPFWSQHTAIGIGFLIGLLVLPVYIGVLADRVERAKQRANEASQAKGRFVANMSHEMRTPLNGVIAMADVLRETSLNEIQREIVETMTTSAHFLLAQIEDVLDIAKIEAGRIQLERRPFDFAKALTSTVKVVLPQARYKELEVLTDISPEVSGWYMGDAHYLRQVVLNLLSNAIKFTERGSVSLRARNVLREDGTTRIRVEVKDTGIGISPAKQATIFDAFSQADDSITRVYGGTGLGTTIARHLVSLMDGTIGLHSEVGRGSTFWFEVPMPKTEPQGIDLSEELSSPIRLSSHAHSTTGTNIRKIRGARILVAEDNLTNQRVTQLILESGGHSATIIDNGEAALDALERGGYDIALFDLSMPVISGLEALKMYRFSVPNPIPILILSANVTTEAISECLKAGAAEFIPKPLRASVLLDTIERQLASVPLTQARPAATARVEERPPLSVVDSPPIDEQVLYDLERLSTDPTFVERLLRGYREDTERLVRQIGDAIAQRKYEAVKDYAHALKGGSASVGASQLARLSVRLEKASHESLRVKAIMWIEELTETSNRTYETLDHYLATRHEQQQYPH